MKEEKERKSPKKQQRSHEVLMGVITLYLKLGKHIGSNTLRENGFDHLSPATIRNYFAELEKEGFLEQAHASGGRIPTHKAFRLYAKDSVNQLSSEGVMTLLPLMEERAITKYLTQVAELLSDLSGYPTFFSSCRFDHDLITKIHLVQLDLKRILCVIMTEFGQLFTEVLGINKKLSSFALRRWESYFLWKLTGNNKPLTLSKEEEASALALYNEIIVRYLVRYSNFSDEDLYRTGFSKLLAFPEFNDPVALTEALSLFENHAHMRLLLNDAAKRGILSYFIGHDLAPYGIGSNVCTALTVPYSVGPTIVGAFGILGPVRMDYPKLFALLSDISQGVSKALTETLYKYKLSYRQPRSGAYYLDSEFKTQLLEVKEKE